MAVAVDNEIRGKLALVTGASSGIGASCAKDLYDQGAALAVTYSTNKAGIDALVASLAAPTSSPQQGGDKQRRVTVHQADMSSASDLSRLFDEIHAQHGQHPDILISNAGYGKRIPQIVDIPLEEWDKMMTINVRASFILCKLAVPHMIARHWGRIILMSSIAAYGGGINGCHYAASKAALTGMVKNLANKLAKDGITVNDVAPAMIGDTGMIPDAKFVEGTPGDVRNIPVGRLGTPQECANVCTMLVRTGYLTGQSILLTGGLK